MGRFTHRIGLVVVLGLALGPPATACLWDYDTLAVELARFPKALELICGKFVRHSPEFYRWRVDDRLARLEEQSSAADWNDLAVAYDKLGEHDKAIESALECERRHGRSYQTAANLGTFHIHAGRHAEGLRHIDAALEINPDAHFGRERYQKWLVEYLQTKAVDGEIAQPLDSGWPEEHHYWHRYRGFALYLIERFVPETLDEQDDFGGGFGEEPNELIEDGVQGVLGMMRFGRYESPILLEALGDLLVASHRRVDGKRLAARAYLRASHACDDEPAVVSYRMLAQRCLEIHVDHDQPGSPPMLTLDALEDRLAVELRDAEQWYGELVSRERAWIAAGLDVDAEFTRAYYDTDPSVNSPGSWTYWEIKTLRLGIRVALLLLLCGLIVVGVFDKRSFRLSRE